jgi:hypothetical protein
MRHSLQVMSVLLGAAATTLLVVHFGATRVVGGDGAPNPNPLPCLKQWLAELQAEGCPSISLCPVLYYCREKTEMDPGGDIVWWCECQ